MSTSHKIKKILKSADLPKDLSEDLKKELESHFYEKERDLRLSGVSEKEVEQKVEEDFGDEEIVGSYFNFVHKKSFYSFIKALMKNTHKPSIFKTVFLFLLLVLFYQNTVFDMATVVELTRNGEYQFFALLQNNFRLLVLGLILVLSLILAIRLVKGKSFAQRFTAAILLIAICIEIGITHSLIKSYVILPEPKAIVLDQELIQNPQNYDEPEKASWISFFNANDGYQLGLPLSYMAYRKDGTSDLGRYFSPPNARFEPEAGEIVAFGPAYASDQEMIEVKVFDADNSPDKKVDETWLEYYLRTQLSNAKYQLEPSQSEPFFGNDSELVMIPGAQNIHLAEPLRMRQDILLQEYNNRLYAFLYDAKNLIHKEIIGGGIGTSAPDKKVAWVSFDDPNCPFTIQTPDYWQTGYVGQTGEHVDIDKCEGLAFSIESGPVNRIVLQSKMIENQNLGSYFKSQDFEVKRMGETEWQEMPARRFLLSGPQDYQEAAFAVELRPNSWLTFSYSAYDPEVQKALNTLVIK